MYAILSLVMDRLARAMAYAGGAVLIVLITATALSIIGRALVSLDIGLGPIRGIYDYTEMGMAAAIFAFLPWAHLKEAHAKVDLFRGVIPEKVDQLFDLLFNIFMAVVAIVGTWRLYLGMEDKLSYGETTLIAQIPVWQGFAAGLIGAIGFSIIAVFCVLRSGRRLIGLKDEE